MRFTPTPAHRTVVKYPLLVTLLTVALLGSLAAGMPGADAATSTAVGHPNFTAISFADRRDGWVAAVAANGSSMLHTTDGGRTWMRYPVNFDVRQMQFINARQGWAIGSTPRVCGTPRTLCHSVIAATDDGGRHWVWQRQSPGCGQASSLDFADAVHGWAVESNWSCVTRPSQPVVSRVIRTDDGGRIWRVVLSPAAAAGSVHFGDRLQGWFAAGGIGTNHCFTTVFHSADGGLSWTRQFRVSGYCSPSVDFVNDVDGWLLVTNWGMCSMGGCYDNRLYRTHDGGRHWNLAQSARLPEPRVPALWSGPSGFLGTVLFVTP